MSAAHRTLFFFNVNTVCHVWDGALWEMPDQICMTMRQSCGMKGKQSGPNISSRFQIPVRSKNGHAEL